MSEPQRDRWKPKKNLVKSLTWLVKLNIDSPRHWYNRLDLVLTDAPDILDVSVGTPLATSDYCSVRCVLHVEQAIPEYNMSELLSEASYQLNRTVFAMQSGALHEAPF